MDVRNLISLRQIKMCLNFCFSAGMDCESDANVVTDTQIHCNWHIVTGTDRLMRILIIMNDRYVVTEANTCTDVGRH